MNKEFFEKRNLLLILSLLLIFICYLTFLFAPFYFDDFYNIVCNDSLNSLKDALMCRRGGFRPFSYLWFYFDKKFFGSVPFYFRLENVFIHLINFVLVFNIFKKLTESGFKKDSFLISLFAALFWALNPLNSQSVAYIVQRMNEVATFFTLLGFLFYLDFFETGRKRYILGFLFSLIAGMGFKETGILLIPLCLLHFMFFKSFKKGLIGFVVFLFSAFFAVFFIPQFESILPVEYLLGNPVNEKHFTLIEKFLTSFKVILDYVIVYIFPVFKNIHLYYDFSIEKSLFSISVLIPLIVIALSLIAGIIMFKKDRLMSFLLFAFLLLLFPENSFLPLDIAYQHRMYLPSVFFSLFLIIIVFKFLKEERFVYVFFALLLVFLALNLVVRGIVFSIPEKFYANELKHAEKNEKIYVNASKNLLDRGNIEEAYYYLEKGLKLFPDDSMLAMNMGLFFAKTGDIDRAIFWYKKAENKDNPFLKGVYWSLAVLYLKKGDVENFRTYLELLKKNNYPKFKIKLLEKKIEKVKKDFFKKN